MRIKIQTSFVQYKQNKNFVFCNLVKFKWSTKKLGFFPNWNQILFKMETKQKNFHATKISITNQRYHSWTIFQYFLVGSHLVNVTISSTWTLDSLGRCSMVFLWSEQAHCQKSFLISKPYTHNFMKNILIFVF
jgi:hypothetical protein